MNQESKIKELDTQLANILEERLKLARQMSNNGIIKEDDFQTKLEGKATTLILNSLFKKFEEKYKGQTIPRPPYWSGFSVCAEKNEFWIQKPYRLHDRTVYIKGPDNHWIVEKLYP